MRIKLSEIRVVGRHRVSSVPPSAWSLPDPYAPLERAAQAAGHGGCGRGPALRALDNGRLVPYLDAHGQPRGPAPAAVVNAESELVGSRIRACGVCEVDRSGWAVVVRGTARRVYGWN
jgi:hypothetical protein